MPGPVPKRSEERRRRNKAGATDRAPSGASAVEAPPAPDGNWERCHACKGVGRADRDECPTCKGTGQVFLPLHELAADWYDSLRTSGQSRFYEESDWQLARYLAHEMSRSMRRNLSAETIRSLLAGMGELLTSEASRRRVRLELEKTPTNPVVSAGVTALAEYRRTLGA